MDGYQPVTALAPFASAADCNVIPIEYQASTIALAQKFEYYLWQRIPTEQRNRVDVCHSASDRKAGGCTIPIRGMTSLTEPLRCYEIRVPARCATLEEFGAMPYVMHRGAPSPYIHGLRAMPVCGAYLFFRLTHGLAQSGGQPIRSSYWIRRAQTFLLCRPVQQVVARINYAPGKFPIYRAATFDAPFAERHRADAQEACCFRSREKGHRHCRR
jgi:hypothetical protein